MAYGSITNQTFSFDPNDITINASQIIGTLASSQIPNLDASKITSGILPVSRGGTGASNLSGLKAQISSFTQIGSYNLANATIGATVNISLTSSASNFQEFIIAIVELAPQGSGIMTVSFPTITNYFTSGTTYGDIRPDTNLAWQANSTYGNGNFIMYIVALGGNMSNKALSITNTIQNYDANLYAQQRYAFGSGLVNFSRTNTLSVLCTQTRGTITGKSGYVYVYAR